MDGVSAETPEAAYRLLHERVTGEPPRRSEKALSAVQYDKARSAYLAEERIVAKPGVAVWPPTSQTLMKRLGDGSWSAAMAHLGLAVNSGRARGAGSFTDDDYLASVTEFLSAATDAGDTSITSDSFVEYTAWAKAASDGARRPSGAAVRQHFGSWDAAKTAAKSKGM